jgi:uncharacterized protein YlxW (UPF0749 family)
VAAERPQHQAEHPLPERVTMGLLPYINAHALDEDYAEAARQRAGSGQPPRRRIGRYGAAMLAVFALLTITAAVQTSRDSSSDEQERQALIKQVKDAKTLVDRENNQVISLQTENRRLQQQFLASNSDSLGLLGEVSLLGLRSGLSPATGPGVEVVADDAAGAKSDRNRVLDTDLQKLVNGLWQAGAEAISINGERLTTLSSIRHAGSAITVNYVSLRRPYRILAVGNRQTLPSRFADSTSGQAWLDLQQEVGLRFSMHTESSMNLPGSDVPQLRYVEAGDKKDSTGKGPT